MVFGYTPEHLLLKYEKFQQDIGLTMLIVFTLYPYLRTKGSDVRTTLINKSGFLLTMIKSISKELLVTYVVHEHH